MLYAALKKIKVAPVVELVNHWLHSIKTSTAILCTSLINRHPASVDPHATNTIIYNTTLCIMINESYLSRISVRGTLTDVHDEIARTQVEASNSTLYPVTRTVIDDRSLKDGKGVE